MCIGSAAIFTSFLLTMTKADPGPARRARAPLFEKKGLVFANFHCIYANTLILVNMHFIYRVGTDPPPLPRFEIPGSAPG